MIYLSELCSLFLKHQRWPHLEALRLSDRSHTADASASSASCRVMVSRAISRRAYTCSRFLCKSGGVGTQQRGANGRADTQAAMHGDFHNQNAGLKTRVVVGRGTCVTPRISEAPRSKSSFNLTPKTHLTKKKRRPIDTSSHGLL